MSLSGALKSVLPRQLFLELKTLYNISYGLNATRARNYAIASGNVNRLYFNESLFVYPPDLYYPSCIFHSHFLEPELRQEMSEFLTLAKDCTSLIDVGASGGIFSAMFAQSRPEYRILAVEPDPLAIEVLKQVRERNGEVARWDIAEVALSDGPGEIDFYSYGYGGESHAPLATANVGGEAENPWYRGAPTITKVKTQTLAECAAEHAIQPDIMKIDIETFEVELIAGSLDFLKDIKPRLHLELHTQMIRDRGLDPADVLRQLAEIGYRSTANGRPADQIDVRPTGPIRVGLVAA